MTVPGEYAHEARYHTNQCKCGGHHVMEANAMSQGPYGPPEPAPQPVPGQVGPPTQPYLRRPRNGAGVAALVLGIVGLVLAVLVLPAPLGALLGLLGAIFGAIGISRVGQGLATNRGQAVTGLVTGILALALGVFLTVRVGTFFERHSTDFNNLSRCMNDSNTNQERRDCANRFINDIDRNR